MSHSFEADRGASTLTDREIAEDILLSTKYISNYYYAPAVLESMDPRLRSTFQEINNNTQSQAKQVFDYLNSKGWYNPRQADAQSVNELRNAAQESQHILASISEKISDPGGKSTVIGSQNIHSHENPSNFPGGGWQSQSPSQSLQTGGGWQSQGHSQSQHAGGGWPTQPHQQTQGQHWTGTQYGEGHSGTGPSSLGQWASWGGQPSLTQEESGSHYGTYGSQSTFGGHGSHTGYMSPGTHSAGTGYSQVGTGWQPTYSQVPHWTGTEAEEGRSGLGPSSLANWTRWGGQPSQMQGGAGGQFSGGYGTHYPTAGHQGYVGAGGYAGSGGHSTGFQPFQSGSSWQSTFSQRPAWTGTQAGEGHSGTGPSSLAGWAQWGGQPSWMQSQHGVQGGRWR